MPFTYSNSERTIGNNKEKINFYSQKAYSLAKLVAPNKG